MISTPLALVIVGFAWSVSLSLIAIDDRGNEPEFVVAMEVTAMFMMVVGGVWLVMGSVVN